MTPRRDFTIGIGALLRKVRGLCPVCDEAIEAEPGFRAVSTSDHSHVHDACAERYRAGVTEQLQRLREGWPSGDAAAFLWELILEGAEDVTVARDSYDELLDFAHLVHDQASMILEDDEEEPTRPTPATLRSGQVEREVQNEEERFD